MSKLKVINLSGDNKFQRLLAGEPETFGVKSGHVCLECGESVGEHTTENKQEIIIILDGEAEISCDKKILEVKRNSLVYIPPAAVHDVKNIGRELLRYVYITSPVSKS